MGALPAMNPDLHLTISLGTALTLIGVVWRASAQISEMKLKVDTLWDYVIRRGRAEGLHAGALAQNSPITITPDARRWFEGLAGDLHAWYQKAGRGLADRELYVALEKQFGERITNEVCVPHRVHAGACLAMAALVCREVDSL